MSLQRFYLTYGEEKIKDPIIYSVGHKFRVVTNIRGASISDKIGIVALELEGDDDEIRKAVEWIAEQGVKVEPIEKNVIE
jgi:L-aspartate semialdehyde sulfurtransferase ferredoxin